MIDFQKVTPGGWYWSTQPGGWADATTGLHFPGPIVTVNRITRQITGVDSQPAPIQLPTHKESFSLKNPKEREVCEFDRHDSEALCEALNLALQTGNIEQVPVEKVRELYPRAFAKRRDKIVFKRSHNEENKPLKVLVDDFLQSRRVKLQEGLTADAQDQETAARRERDRQRRIRHELENSVPGSASLNSSNDLDSETLETEVEVLTPPVPPLPPAE